MSIVVAELDEASLRRRTVEALKPILDTHVGWMCSYSTLGEIMEEIVDGMMESITSRNGKD